MVKKKEKKRKETCIGKHHENVYTGKVNSIRHVKPKAIDAKFQIKCYTLYILEEASNSFAKNKTI